jgi:deoxyadenosine/deoxycytidine kinase
VTKYHNIAIEGNIGVGKTLLAEKLAADLHAQIILERFSENPFLARFYSQPQQYALQVELGFLLDRYKQLNDRPAVNAGLITISDYIFDKSLVFAGINLQPDEFVIFRQLFEILLKDILKPQIIIYLYNHPEGLKNNIRKRGREFEQGIEELYLQQIESAYRKYFSRMDSIPVLLFDISDKDLLTDDGFYQQIRDSLEKDWPAGLSEV